MSLNLKKAFRQTTAVLLLSVAGAGAGGYAWHATHGTLDAHKSPEEIQAMAVYHDRIKVISDKQASLMTTGDEESASRLERWKRAFISDVVLDTKISETDVGQLAAQFNKLSTDDGIVFRFAQENPKSVRERNEAVMDVPLVESDRVETGERVQDMMMAYDVKDHQATEASAETGALVGAALAASFMLGGMAARRRKTAPGA